MIAAALTLAAAPAWAADGRVTLSVPPPVSPGIAAMPLLAHPANAAERRVNGALRQLDGAVRKAWAGCRDPSVHDPYWKRTVDVPMRGPRFLSVVVTEDLDCGAAHPYADTWAVVYDLRTGRPVDWAALLPRALAGTLALGEGFDQTRTVRLRSARLWALYLAGYDHDGGPSEDAECRNALAGEGAGGPPAMSAWLDARQGGLVVHFNLPPVVQNCAEPGLIPAATLRQEGADPALTQALGAANAR